jgi:hypothetical protein
MANTVVPKGKNLPAGWLKNPAQLDPRGVDAARQEMLESKETFVSRTGRQITPTFREVQGGKASAASAAASAPDSFVITADFADEGNPAVTAQPQTSTRAVAQPQRVSSSGQIPLQREYEKEIEEKNGVTITRETFQNPDGSWTGLISYSNGSGQERFDAPTLRGLSAALLRGKSHGTLFVKDANTSRKLGRTLQTWADALKFMRVSDADFNSMTPDARRLCIDSFQTKEVQRYFNQHSTEITDSDANVAAIIRLQLEMGSVPLTFHNLGVLVENLREQGKLELYSSRTSVPAPVVRPTTVAAETAAAVATSIAEQPRKRGQRQQSGIIPGQGSYDGSTNLYPDGRPRANLNTDASAVQQAKDMPIDQLRRQVIPALKPGFQGRRG